MARKKSKPIPPMARLRRTSRMVEESGLSERTLYRKAENGELTIYKVGNATYWSLDELDALVTRGRGAA